MSHDLAISRTFSGCFSFLKGRRRVYLQETDTKELNVTECSQHDAKQQGKARRYGKYTVQSTFAGSCSITDVMNCYIERKASLRYQ